MRAIEGETPFCSAHKDIIYLGIKITPKLEHHYKANFPPLLRQLKADFARGRTAYLSWIGRINAIKMNVLQRLLYLFQGLPIQADKALFSELKTLITKFIWQGRRARLSYKMLTRPREEGGLALPDFLGYYRAAQLRVITEWSLRESEKAWLHMDRQITGRTIWDLLWKHKQHWPRNAYISTPTATTLGVWDILNRTTPLTTFPSPYILTPSFPPALQEGPFDAWREGGCLMLSHLFEGGKLLSFQECSRAFQFQPTEEYHYLQLKHWSLQLKVRQAATRELLPIEKFAQSGASSRGTISSLYSLLRARCSPHTSRHQRFRDTLLDSPLQTKQWASLYRDIPKFNSSMFLREAHYKIMYEWYFHPQRLHTIFPNTSDRC